jgi:hypothetical protein
MIELVICKHIRDGYKVVLPKNMKVKILAKYSKGIVSSPSELKPNDKIKFVGWVTSSNEDRSLWRHFL